MNRRNILNLSAAAVLGLAFATNSASGQQKTLKEQLVGVWTLVSFESFDAAGAKVPNMEGTDLKGLLILTDGGRLSVQMIAAFPTIASKDRLKTTPRKTRQSRTDCFPTLVRIESAIPTRPSAIALSAAHSRTKSRGLMQSAWQR